MKDTSLQRRIQYIAESVIKDMLNENLGTNQKKARNAYLFYKFGEASSYTDAQKTEAFNFINHKQISKEIPNALADDMFFACGAVRLLFDEEIEPKEVNNIIKFALKNKSKFDRDLNGLSYDELKKELEGNSNAQTSTDTPSKKHQYTVKVARTFEESKSICKDIPDCDWCIGRDSWAFEKYVGGKGCFVFLIRDDYKDVKQVSGDNSPLDDYGTSAFAVGLQIDELNIETNGFGFYADLRIEDTTITCRWNHANDGDDYVVTTDELSDIVDEYVDDTISEILVDTENSIGDKIGDEIDELGKRIAQDVDLKSDIMEFLDEYIEGECNLKYLQENIRRLYAEYAKKVYHDYPLISGHDLRLSIISGSLYRDIDFLKLILGDGEGTSKMVEYNGHVIIVDDNRDEMDVLKPLSSSKGVYVSEDGQYIDMNSKIMKLVVYDKELKTIDVEEGFNIDDYVLLYDHSVVTAIAKNAGENVLEKIRGNIGEQGYNFALERLKQGDYIHTFELLARVKYMKVYIR